MKYKYKSLINHKHGNDYQRERFYNERFDTCQYIVFEKLDGSNVSMNITEDGVVFNSRNQSLGDSLDSIGFNGLGVALEEFEPIIMNIQNTIIDNPMLTCVTLFGEYYGGNIQKRINYGAKKQVRIFDVLFDSKYLNQQTAMDFMFDMTPSDMCVLYVPTVGIYNDLESALQAPYDTASSYGIDGDIREGNVIKPFDADPEYGDNIFYIKMKNDKFKERESKKIIDPEKQAKSNARKEKIALFRTYINENRVMSLLSKGVENDVRNYGDIIKGVIEDAMIDYNNDKEAGWRELTTKDVAKLGSVIVMHLKTIERREF